jgi:hypothetical protein
VATTEICCIEGCGKPRDGRNRLCAAHRARRKRHGDPQGGAPQRNVRYKWLSDHQSYDGFDCLLWPFARLAKTGYPVIHRPGNKTVTSASRVMCEMVNGPPPEDWYQAAHTCGGGHLGCMHPKHLVWKTPADNHADKRIHGTLVAGSKVWNSKLTDEQVRYIRDMAGFTPQAKLAAHLGVSTTTISRIILGHSYR